MPMYKIKSCPHCKKTYDFDHDRRGIGSPLLQCPSCSNLIIDTDMNEWELKDPISKIIYIILSVYTAFMYGLLSPLIAWGIADLFDYDSEAHGYNFFIISYAIGVFLIALVALWSNKGDIKESKERMKDSEYRLLLKKAGLL
jgi:hypothetical protein